MVGGGLPKPEGKQFFIKGIICIYIHYIRTYIHIYNKFMYVYVNFIFMYISSKCKSYYRQVKCHFFFDYFHCCIAYICCSVAQSCPTLCNPMDCSTPGFPVFQISWILLKLMSIELVIPSDHLFLFHPLILLPSVFPNIRVLSS